VSEFPVLMGENELAERLNIRQSDTSKNRWF
jgi:hypothetical protein